MGLDITAYRKVEKIDCVFDADGEPIDPQTRELLDGDYAQPRINDDFPGRADSVEHNACYRFAEDMGFRAGSYGGYNRWRDMLAELAGYEKRSYDEGNGYTRESHCVPCWQGESGPFSEIINFSDCEGTIDAKVSKKLAGDFAAFQARADAHKEPWFLDNYNLFRQAFEMATDGGFVEFH